MVAKKKAAGKGVALWDEKLAAMATEEASREKMGAGSTISLKGGIMSFNGAQLDGNEVDAVVVEHIMTKAYYEGKFDPDNRQPPVCYAYGKVEDEMAPSDQSYRKQADNCEDCPHNAWGSADTGRGKACKDGRRLALIARDDIEDIENAPVALLNIPPTSIAEWKTYVNKLAKQTNRPPLAFITNIKVVNDAESQFKVKFAALEQFDDADTFEALIAKRDDVIDSMQHEYEAPTEAPAKPARGKAAPSRKGIGSGKAAAPAKAAPAAKAPKRKF